MILHTVTITGADDSTDIQELVDLSAEFPFLELGILVSKSQEGGPRFPSRSWIDKLGEQVTVENGLRVAMHLCGRWMRELLTGDLAWGDLPSVVSFASSYQFNTHGVTVTPDPQRFIEKLASRRILRTFIFQWNPVAEPLALLAASRDLNVMGLFDGSGGAGKLPENGWPSPHGIAFPMGFAGGIGPDNVLDQLAKIQEACGDRQIPTWIDMEGRVRTDDGVKLDMNRVRSVLKQVAASKFMAQTVLTA
jgi:hypothetical protein